MGDVIEFNRKKLDGVLIVDSANGVISSEPKMEFFDRLQRIRESLARIDILMVEMKKLQENKEDPCSH